ncbi:MAG: hypothetical protein U5N85_09840 [Arcicella sp.]|nr:hypothetical protein [Arcicella sp.]
MSISVSGNNASFTLTRCTGGNFSTSGNFFIKETNACGVVINNTSVPVASGTSSSVFTGVSLLNGGQSKTFVGVYITSATNPTRYYTGPITVTPTCTSPSGLSATNITETSFRGNWGSVSGVTSYKTQRDLQSIAYQNNLIGVGNSTSYNFTGLNNGAAYKFQAGAMCNNQKEGWSSSFNIQLLAPLNTPTLTSPINITTSSTSVTLQWSKNGNPTGTDYQLRIRNVTDNIVLENYTSLGNVSSYSINLQNGKEYSWVIRARKNGNNDKESASATFYTPALIPTVQVNNPTSNTWGFGQQKQIQWTTTNGGCAPYMVELSTNGGSSWTLIGDQINGTSLNWTVGKDYQGNPIPNMLNNSNLRLKVYCLNNSSVNDQSTNFSLINPTLSITAPPALTTGQAYSISWSLSNAVCTNYTVELSTNGGSTPWTVLKTNHTGSPFSWTVPNDQNGNGIGAAIGSTTNRLKVYCTGYDVINGTSNNFSVSNPTCNLTLPDPNSGTPNNITNTSFIANWPVVSGATQYEINVATFPNTTYGSPLSFNGLSNTNSISVTGLNHSTQYRYQIRAKCSNGVWTSWSSTLATPTTLGPITLNNVTGTTTWHCNKTINWSSLAGTGNITIELGNTDTGFMGVIASNIPNTGSFTWIVGKQVNLQGNVVDFENFEFTKTYYLKIYPHNTEGQGTTGNGFTIPLPTMLVTSPAANSNYTIGQTITMDWGTQNLCGPMMVELTNTAGTTLQVMPNGTNIPNVSPYTYTVTNTFSPGPYRLKIYPSVSGGAAPVFKLTEIFNIIGQSVTVSSPAANSTYQTGTVLPIVYAFTGYTGNVSIEITSGANGTVGILPAIADNVANTGSANWTIPNTFTPGQYRIKVYNTGSGSIVNYSGVFTINCNINL